jgi:tRNA A-37 threonylcarbamoyl transferase component Bud32
METELQAARYLLYVAAAKVTAKGTSLSGRERGSGLPLPARRHRERDLDHGRHPGNRRKQEAFWEATVTTIAEDAGLPVARIHEVLCVDEKTVIKMDYIQGETLLNLMLNDVGNAKNYIERLVKLQCSVYEVKADLPLFLKDVLRGKINNTRKLNETQKNAVIVKLNILPDGNFLCHNDFHPLNIICMQNRDYIIDWVNMSTGCKYADGCYTYMLLALYYKEIAPVYLETYCRLQNIENEKVLEWLPVIAAVRLDDNNQSEHDQLMAWVGQIL